MLHALCIRRVYLVKTSYISPSNVLNTRRMRPKTIPVSLPVIPPRSSSVHLERLDRLNILADNEELSGVNESDKELGSHEETCQF